MGPPLFFFDLFCGDPENKDSLPRLRSGKNSWLDIAVRVPQICPAETQPRENVFSLACLRTSHRDSTLFLDSSRNFNLSRRATNCCPGMALDYETITERRDIEAPFKRYYPSSDEVDGVVEPPSVWHGDGMSW